MSADRDACDIADDMIHTLEVVVRDEMQMEINRLQDWSYQARLMFHECIYELERYPGHPDLVERIFALMEARP